MPSSVITHTKLENSFSLSLPPSSLSLCLSVCHFSCLFSEFSPSLSQKKSVLSCIVRYMSKVVSYALKHTYPHSQPTTHKHTEIHIHTASQHTITLIYISTQPANTQAHKKLAGCHGCVLTSGSFVVCTPCVRAATNWSSCPRHSPTCQCYELLTLRTTRY